MKVNKGELTVIRAKRNACNIYKLLGNTSICDVPLVKSDNDST